LHPLVWPVVVKLHMKFTWLLVPFLAFLSGVITILVSYFVYKKLELPIIRYGKRLAALLNASKLKRIEGEKEQVFFNR